MATRLLNNKRGKTNLICGENYIYSTLNKQGGYQYWKCLEYRRENCSAVAKTFIEGKELLNIPEHSHPSDITKIHFLLAECHALNKAIENPALPPRVILAEIANNLRQQGGQLMPKTSSACIRSLQRVSVAHGGHPVTPQTFTEAVELLPEKYKLTAGGERFLRYSGDTVENGDTTFMLFMSTVGIDVLKQSKVWYADGTFSTAPVPYAQVYIVFGNTSEGKVLPCAFGVLPNKQTVTYRSFWTQIKHAIDSGIQPAYCPTHLIVDFEAAVIKAFLEVYPAAKITGCHFHFRY